MTQQEINDGFANWCSLMQLDPTESEYTNFVEMINTLNND